RSGTSAPTRRSPRNASRAGNGGWHRRKSPCGRRRWRITWWSPVTNCPGRDGRRGPTYSATGGRPPRTAWLPRSGLCPASVPARRSPTSQPPPPCPPPLCNTPDTPRDLGVGVRHLPLDLGVVVALIG